MSEKKLLVVESPAKAKTLHKYLGSGYIVEASVGHIKDLVKINIGVDIENEFKPKYTTIKGKAEVIKKLKKLAEKSSQVLIATDPDREGEAIAWHIAEEVKAKNKAIKRVLFNEITKSGIQKGLSEPRALDKNLFMSQQARRVMDRLIGYKVSPFLSRAMIEQTTKALSAGRVQSVALRLICDREDEIRKFVPIEYWSLFGEFEAGKDKILKARLVAFDGNNIKNPEGSAKAANDDEQKKLDDELASLNFIRTEEQANELINRITQENYSIDSITKKKISRKPLPPFTTSLLQQEASKRLGFSNKKTMMIAQKLYEGVNIGKEGSVGLITYMRTDSMRLSPEALSAARVLIQNAFGKDYLPDKPQEYFSKTTNVQDAHEAIRPTSLDYSPQEVAKYLQKDEAALYELIYNRFLSSQMKPALLEQTTINIIGGDFVFRVTGSVILFKGFLAAYDDVTDNGKNGNDTGQSILPEGLKENQNVELKKLEPQQSFTKPKAHFTEATLVKELDELGIGRPSTYAQIISTLIEREYVEQSKKTFTPTSLGDEVNSILVKNFPDLFNVGFTAEMENELDLIAEGDKTYLEVLNNFYNPFSRSLAHAEQHSDIPEIPCPKCGAPMIIRVSRRGRFLGCSRFPDCTGTKPLPKENGSEAKEPEIVEGLSCPICGKPMVVRQSKFGRFYGCIDYPNCNGILQISSGVKCPKCHEGQLNERYSPKSKKKFWGCSNYPKCEYLTNYEPVDQSCPNCNHYYIEVRYKKVEESYEKYLRCPECKESFDIATMEKIRN